MLGVVDKVDERCNDMYNFVVNKIEEVQTRIRDLKRIEQMLLNLKECCPDDKTLYKSINGSLVEEGNTKKKPIRNKSGASQQ